MNKFLAKFKIGSRFRQFITNKSLLTMVDDYNEKDGSDEEGKKLEYLVKMSIGKPAIVEALTDGEEEVLVVKQDEEVIDTYTYPVKKEEVKEEEPVVEETKEEVVDDAPVMDVAIGDLPEDDTKEEEKDVEVFDVVEEEKKEEPVDEEPAIEEPVVEYSVSVEYGEENMKDMGVLSVEKADEEWIITAITKEGFVFTGWKLNGKGKYIKTNPYKVSNITSDKLYKGYFEAADVQE